MSIIKAWGYDAMCCLRFRPLTTALWVGACCC